MDVSVAFGKALRKLRVAKGITQEQLGFEAGLRRTYISSLELGEKHPSLESVYKLSIALDMKMSAFLIAVEKEMG